MENNETPVRSAAVILQPQTDQLKDERSKVFYGQRKLTDYGDHVEWTDGKKIWKWRLPDQPAGADNYPVLKSILFVPAKSAVGVPVKMSRLAFIADDGHILTHFSTRLPILPVELLGKVLPDNAYQALEARGVSRTHEEYASIKQLYAAHPDPSLNKFSRSFAEHTGLWMLFIIIDIIIVVNGILLLTGYYSN